MKVALVHDYIKEYGGAERVLEALHEAFPQAPVFTSLYLPEYLGPHRERFAGWDIRTSFLQYIPFKERLISPLRLLAPLAFFFFDFSDFDVVIVSSTGAYLPNMIKTKSPVVSRQSLESSQRPTTNDQRPIHICYCHTPPRYLYGYATAREWKKRPVFKVFAEIANHFLRLIDFKSAQNVDYFIANSQNVQARIEKFYRKKSIVIYPPSVASRQSPVVSRQSLESSQRPTTKDQRPYYITGGRLARPKHIDLIVKTCVKNNWNLVIFGKEFAGYGEELREIAKGKENIIFAGEVGDSEKLSLMKGAKAFIFSAEDEDFGITPVEAMSVGILVIAYRSGGVVESVIEGRTGIFFDALSEASLEEAIKKFEKRTFNKIDCIRQADNFSREKFIKEIKAFVHNL